MTDRRALVHLVPGRMALSGLGVRAATMAVVSDYLVVAGTMGETLQAPGPLEPAPDSEERRRAAEAEAARERDAERQARNRRAELAGEVKVVVRGFRMLHLELEAVDPAYRTDADRNNGRLDSYIEDAEDTDSIEELQRIVEDSQRICEKGLELRTHLIRRDATGDVLDAENADTLWICNDCGLRFTEPVYDPTTSRKRRFARTAHKTI
jgi:hypothetical protein